MRRRYFFGDRIKKIGSSRQQWVSLWLFCACCCLFFSCKVTRKVPEGSYFLHSVNVELGHPKYSDNPAALRDQMLLLHRPKLNQKWANLVRGKLWFYNWGFKGGEAPVLTDTIAFGRSAFNMEKYLYQQGYFGSRVEYSEKVRFWNKKSKKLTYTVQLQPRHIIDTVIYPQDSLASSIFDNQIWEQSLIKKGEAFSGAVLQAERERVRKYLLNKGYFDYSVDNLQFELDSSGRTHALQIEYQLIDAYKLRPYSVRNVSIDIDTQRSDTLITNQYDGKTYRQPLSSAIKIEAINPFIYLHPDSLLRKDIYDRTLSHLLELGVFSFIDPQFTKVEDSVAAAKDKYYYDIKLSLQSAKRKQITNTIEASNRYGGTTAINQGLVGVAVSTNYHNRNWLGGAERFSAGLYNSIELNLRNDTTTLNGTRLINSLEITANAEWTFPKFLGAPFLNAADHSRLPSTKIDLSNTYRNTFNQYTINGTELSFGYEWKNRRRASFVWQPVFFNYFQTFNYSDDFAELLTNDFRLLSSFESRFIVGGAFTYNFNSQTNLSKNTNFWTFRGDIELAGNSLYLLDRAVKTLTSLDNSLFKDNILDYSQYIRLQGNLRKYWYFSTENVLAARLYSAFALPYGNSQAEELPIIKQFSLGGTNSVRAFKVRSVGPGSFGLNEVEEVNEYDRVGNMKLEASVEYRFPLWSYFYLKGAFFADAGNVWILKKSTDEFETRARGIFRWNRFYNEIAMGGGFGLRIDIPYALIRIDVAIPFYKPYYDLGSRWVFNEINFGNKTWRRENIVPTLAIGYPF